MSKSIAYFLFFCLAFPALTLAQPGDPLGGKDSLVLTNERIEDVIDSEKPFLKPPSQQLKPGKAEEMQYNSQSFYVPTQFEPNPPIIRPVEREKPEALRNNFVKLGIGRYVTPFAQLYLNNGRDRDIDYGLDFTHISAHQDEIPLRRFREDFGTLHAEVLSREYTLKGKMHLYNTGYFFYADPIYSAEDTLLGENADLREDTLRNSFTRFQFGASLVSNYDKKQPFEYDAGWDLRFFNEARKNREFSFSLLPNGFYRINDEFKVGLESEINYTDGRSGFEGSLNQNRFFVEATPQVRYQSGALNLRAGIRLNYFSNNADSLNYSNVGPDIEVSYAILPEALTAFVGYTSGMQRNDLYDMFFENRYLSDSIFLKPSIEKMNIFAGIKGQLNDAWDYTARVFYRRVENQLIYFAPDTLYRFDALYDSLTTISGLYAGINYAVNDELGAGAALSINNYGTTTVERYFHASPLRLDVYAKYVYQEKLTAQASLNVFGSSPMSVDAEGEIIRRGLFARLNAGVDYRITDGFSVFLSVNNLLNSNYQRWHNYPERRIDFRAGLTLGF